MMFCPVSLSLQYITHFVSLASTKTPVDEGDAFPAREWLRQLVVGKFVRFETTPVTLNNNNNNNNNNKKTSTTASPPVGTTDRVYGCLFLIEPANVAEGKEEIRSEERRVGKEC